MSSQPGSTYNRCYTCPKNTYNDEPGFSGLTCKPCPVGFASPAGSTSFANCTICPAGSYMLTNYDDRYDAKYQLCVPCPASTYNPEPGRTGSTAASCPPCPRGYTSPPGSTNCTVCAAGSFVYDANKYDSNFMQCTICPANTYNPGPGLQGSSCLPCPRGYTSLPGSTSCTICAAGSFVYDANKYDSKFMQCTICPANTYTPGPGLQGSSCLPCPGGAVSRPGSANVTSCSPCSPGSYFDNAAGSQTLGTCVRCPAGSFTSAPGTVGSCTACPAGLTSRDGA